jgi:hypothetical protein
MELPPDDALPGTWVTGVIGAVPLGLLALDGKLAVGLSVRPSDPA